MRGEPNKGGKTEQYQFRYPFKLCDDRVIQEEHTLFLTKTFIIPLGKATATDCLDSSSSILLKLDHMTLTTHLFSESPLCEFHEFEDLVRRLFQPLSSLSCLSPMVSLQQDPN